jgi:hypothetical protein
MEAQLRVLEAQAQGIRETTQLSRNRFAALQVRAEIDGVVQQISVGEGQQASGEVARVVAPDRLKAVLRIPEVQAREVVIGQRAKVDTRAGVIPGHVTRMDPSAVDGTVSVDVALEGDLPSAARPDLSVDGLIEIDRLGSVLHLARPVAADSERTLRLFRIDPGGDTATRVDVRIGRVSATVVEITGGVEQGDVIILSDMSRWSDYDKIRLR